MDIRVLGPVEASDGDRAIAVGPGKPRAVLAMLALHEGSSVPAEQLIDGLWGETPPATASKMVQGYVSQLRKAFAGSGNGGEIVTRGRGYELRLGGGDVDVRCFERLVKEGRPRDALVLWRGPALDDVAGEPFAPLEIHRLDELHLGAIELAIEQDLAAGRHAEVMGELETLVAQEPLREHLHAQRMLALYRGGRQADALDAYRQVRASLVDAIGVEPGPELRRLHEAILRQDPTLDLPTAEPAEPPPEADWALDAAADRAADERARLQVAEDDLASGIVAREAARERAAAPAGDVVACPFKGLASFDLDDADVFFGRERLVAEMVARLAGASLLGIVGPSGSGKSSALRAGLLPALAHDVLPGSAGWAIALLRPGAHPLAALADAVEAAPSDGRLVIAVDQFEELFTACRDEAERTAFADALVAALRDPRRRALVLIALRADFYGRCAGYPELWRMLGANQVPVGPMRRDELRRAIESPARHAGLVVEPELTDALIAGVEGQPGALPLLSTALLELWQERDGRHLRLSAYERAGGVDGAVARLAERVYEGLEPDQRLAARAVLVRLAGVGEGESAVRRCVPLAELERTPGAIEALAALAALADGRLVTVSGDQAEVAHEALLREWPRLRGWLEEDAEGRRLHHHLGVAAREWDARGRDSGELYRGARLAAALDWSAAHDPELEETERAFLDESRGAAGRSQRRLRGVLAGVATLLLLAVVAGLVALHQGGNARDQATAADAQRLGARALLDDQLDRSLLLARQGVALDDTVRTRGNLLGALVQSPDALGVIRIDGSIVLSAAVSLDGGTLAVGDRDGHVMLYDTSTRRRIATFAPAPNQPAIHDLAYSPDGHRLAVLYTSVPGGTGEVPNGFHHNLALVDTGTRRAVQRIALPVQSAASGVEFSPDSRTVGAMTFGDTQAFLRFDVATGRSRGPAVPVDHPGRLTRDPYQMWPRTPVLFTHHGGGLVVAGKNAVTIRDAATLAERRRFPAAIGTLPTAYALRPDDGVLAIGGEDGSLRLLDLRSGQLHTASGRHRGAVNEARFTPDGRNLVTTGEDGGVILWDVAAAAESETLTGHLNSAFSPQIADHGATLYTASLDGTVLISDLSGRRRLGRRFIAGAGDDSNRYALSPDGRWLAHGQRDGAISLVDLDHPSLRRHATSRVAAESGVEDAGGVEGIAFVPGSHLLVVGSDYGSVLLVDADHGTVIRRLTGHAKDYRAGGYAHANTIWTPGVSADGRLLATGSKDGEVRFWSLPDGRPQGPPLRFRYGNAETQLSPNGRMLSVLPGARGDLQDGLQIYDVRSRRRIATMRPPGGPVLTRWSPDGKRVAESDGLGNVEIYSTATWRQAQAPLSGGKATWLAWSPDSRTLATGDADGSVRLFDVASGQALGAPLPGVAQSLSIPFFTPNGTHVIAAEDNGRAVRWDIRPASLVRHACEVAGRRLTRAEWDEFLPGRDYDPAC
jgi:WD40 repeat protein/DNA-binding SARP family transcriptional activator